MTAVKYEYDYSTDNGDDGHEEGELMQVIQEMVYLVHT